MRPSGISFPRHGRHMFIGPREKLSPAITAAATLMMGAVDRVSGGGQHPGPPRPGQAGERRLTEKLPATLKLFTTRYVAADIASQAMTRPSNQTPSARPVGFFFEREQSSCRDVYPSASGRAACAPSFAQ